MPDTGAVLFAFAPSGTVHFRKALLVSSLKGIRATLDQHGTEPNHVDLQRQDDGDRGAWQPGESSRKTDPHLRIQTRSPEPK